MSDNPQPNKQPNPRRRGPMPGGGPMAMMRGEKAADFSGSIKKLIAYLGKHQLVILFVWLLAIASTVFSIFSPKILGQATDEMFNGFMRRVAGTGSVAFDRIGAILIQLAVLYGLSVLFSYLQGFLIAGVSMKVTYQLRNDIGGKIHRLPLRYFDEHTHGDVLSRITNDVDTISQTLNQSLTQIITSVTSLIGITAMMLTINPIMTLAALLILPLSMVFVMLIVGKSQKFFTAQQSHLGAINGHIEEMFGSHLVVKAFNGEQKSVEAFTEHNEALYQSAWKANFFSSLMFPITGFVGNLGYVAICVLGGTFTVNGSMTIGGIQAFIQYVSQFNQPIVQVANIANVLQQTAAAAERVFKFLSEPEESPDPAQPASALEIQGHIKFEEISFGYSPDKQVIRRFNTEAKPGWKVAIVGPTGAGKTTIVKLLMRFYDLDNGVITLDGADIRRYKRDDLRANFGMVLQDT